MCTLSAAWRSRFSSRAADLLDIRVVPFHPDGSGGGLRPVGAIGLNNQYLLSIYSSMVVKQPLKVPGELRLLMIAAAAIYAVVGPIVFVAPLIQFRAGMLRAKTDLMKTRSRNGSGRELERHSRQAARRRHHQDPTKN